MEDRNTCCELTGRLVACDDLCERDVMGMYALLAAHYEGVDRSTFEHDLSQKNWVVKVETSTGECVGFSTIRFYSTIVAGEHVSVVYSGDTIVDPEHWGSAVLPSTWINSVWRLHADQGQGRLWWLLISSGYRTYRYLSTFWRCFYPRYDCETPAGIQDTLDMLAVDRFNDRYDRQAGVVRLAQPQRLRGHLMGIPEGRRRNPHVAYFERVNPGHSQGDELVCLTELCKANLTRAGRRMAEHSQTSFICQAARA